MRAAIQTVLLGARTRFDPAALFASPQGTMVGLERSYSSGIIVWSQVKESLFIAARLDLTDTASRFSWRETRLCDLKKVYPLRELTLSGSWSQLNTNSSGNTAKYVGDRAGQTSTNSAYAEVSVTRSKTYDIWVIYTGRTDGAFVRVDIDGAQTLVNEITDPASLGYKAFSTVAPVTNTKRLYKKVASGLTGTHTIRATKSANDAGTAFIIEAIAISGDISDAKILPPDLPLNTAVVTGDEFQHNGIYYCAATTGTSSGTPPTHTSGSASDGSITWTAQIYPSYFQPTVVDYSSEREYAFDVTINAVKEDFGGQTHGGETRTDRTIKIDGVDWDPAGAFVTITTGASIAMVETCTWVHSQDSTAATAVLTRTYTPGIFAHDVSVTMSTPSAGLGFAYVGMAPAVSWDGFWQTRVFDRFVGGLSLNLNEYSGLNNPTVTLPTSVLAMAFLGAIAGVKLGYGVRTTAASVNNYANSNAAPFVLPNFNNQAASGGTDWQMKAYLPRAVSGFPETFVDGAVLSFHNESAFALWV